MFKHCNSCCQSADIIFLLTFSLKVQFIKEAGICSLPDPGNVLVKLIMMTSCQCCLLQGHHQHQVCHTDIISSNELILSNKVSLNDILVIFMNFPALIYKLLVRRIMFEKHLKMYIWIMKVYQRITLNISLFCVRVTTFGWMVDCQKSRNSSILVLSLRDLPAYHL